MQIRGFIAWLVPVLLVVAGCYPQIGSGPQDPELRRVEVLDVQGEPVAEAPTLIGSTEPWQEAVLYFEVTGVVAELFVEDGKLVEPGAPIARLVLTDYEAGLSKATAELGAAQAQLDLLRAGTRKEDLDAAKASYAQAAARAAFWTSEWSRVARLFRQGVISTSQLEMVRREHDAAQQEERLTKARLQRAIAGPRKQEIEAAAAEVEARNQAVALAKRQLDKATLRAPFRGRVEKRLLDAGAYINVFPTGGVPVVHLVNLDQVDAVIAVPEALLSHFAGKKTVEIASAIDSSIRAEGKVVSLAQVADPASGTYELRARIPNPAGRFTGEMVVVARAPRQASRQAIQIPITAVGRAYGRPPYVLLVEPDSSKVVARQVMLGSIAGQRIEVLDGLSDGELLIVGGQHRVIAGDRVEYQRTDSASNAPSQKAVP